MGRTTQPATYPSSSDATVPNKISAITVGSCRVAIPPKMTAAMAMRIVGTKIDTLKRRPSTAPAIAPTMTEATIRTCPRSSTAAASMTPPKALMPL